MCLDICEHFMLPSAEKCYGNDDFISQQNLTPTHTAKSANTWFKFHDISRPEYPANSMAWHVYAATRAKETQTMY